MTTVSGEDLDRLRGGLLAFCYQMTGSPFEAEDAVQDVLERAWRARESFDPDRGALSTWCFRIAHNVCVDRIRGYGRRPLPRDLQGPGMEIGAPLVPALDVPWLMPAPRAWFADSAAEAALERAADVRLAVTAMLQALPARQRAVYVLREVLDLPARETADALDLTVAAVNSALQRARAAVATDTATESATDAGTPSSATVERYARAIERADVAALVALVSRDVMLEMPPVRGWLRGVEDYRTFMATLFDTRGRDWSTRPIASTGQYGFLLNLGSGAAAEPHTVQLLSCGTAGTVDHVLVYRDPQLFALFEQVAGPR